MLAVIALAIALSGCTAPTATPAISPAPTGTPATQAAVEIRDFAFNPAEVHVLKGGTVNWTNFDSTTHTVRFTDTESPGFGRGGTYSKMFNNAGTYEYDCSLHPFMKGKVVVE